MANTITFEALAIRVVIAADETNPDDRPSATEQLDETTRAILMALRPRPLASTRPSNVVPMRKVGSR